MLPKIVKLVSGKFRILANSKASSVLVIFSGGQPSGTACKIQVSASFQDRAFKLRDRESVCLLPAPLRGYHPALG